MFFQIVAKASVSGIHFSSSKHLNKGHSLCLRGGARAKAEGLGRLRGSQRERHCPCRYKSRTRRDSAGGFVDGNAASRETHLIKEDNVAIVQAGPSGRWSLCHGHL